jgi:hypothetical protein
MQKWFASAMLVLVAMSGIAWSYAGRPDCPVPEAVVPRPDPHMSADAHRHFSGHTSQWGSMVLILD